MRTKALTNYLWSAFFISVVIYHALIISGRLPVESVSGIELVSYTLLACGIITLLVIVGLDISLISRPRRIRVSADLLPEGTGPVDEDELASQAKAAYYFRLFIITCALAEAPGIIGLVLHLLGGSPVMVHTLLGIAYLTLLYIRMRMATTWEKMYLG